MQHVARHDAQLDDGPMLPISITKYYSDLNSRLFRRREELRQPTGDCFLLSVVQSTFRSISSTKRLCFRARNVADI